MKINITTTTKDPNTFLISRILCHPEITGDEWRETKHCFICEKFSYTLFRIDPYDLPLF